MVIDIKMCRFDNVPWGFRLVGGSDFEYPLTVVKVTEGSIAEEAGLREGDIIVRINDTATSPLTHEETNRLINGCGNVFYFGVQREDPDGECTPMAFPILGEESIANRDSFPETCSSSCKSPSMARSEEEFIGDLADRPSSVLSENTEIKLVEEEIAAVLSGESEVLKEHNIMGIFPKPGVCMSSDVLRTLNAEAIKTKAEKDKENKKWTTFLQKPNRPIPKSKQQLEAERRAANAYKVKIVKSAPRTPSRSVSPAVERPPEPVPMVEPEPEPQKEPTPPQPEEDETPPADSEVPNLEEQLIEERNAPEIQVTAEDETNPGEKEASPELPPVEEEVTSVVATESANENVEKVMSEPERAKTEEELALEKQLADVQQQLAALSSLPSTIQATLDAVTKQLAELLPTFKLQQQQPTAEATNDADTQPRAINLERIEESAEPTKEATDNSDTRPQHSSNAEPGESNKNEKCEESNAVAQPDMNDVPGSVPVAADDNVKQREVMPRKDEMRQMEEEQDLKKQKRHDVIEELEEHLERKNKPSKRSKRAFGPLTPSSERPLVLPGGRRWYRPKDAYNDEFIAEILSAQAELITGSTLGVNFMKYQKPERKIDLNRSEVYKVIHHLDRQPVRGIEVRPPVVPAEADIRKAVQP